ncbi:MAG: ABC transporter permease subunit [Bacillota bacterium]|jgi:simple sugar transport system permease protein
MSNTKLNANGNGNGSDLDNNRTQAQVQAQAQGAEGFLQKVGAAVSEFMKWYGVPRLIITCFLLVLIILAIIYKMDLGSLLGDSLTRVGMNGLLVLAMVPTITCGVGLNFGLPVGIICGLVGGVFSMSMDLTGFTGFFVAIALALPLSVIAGWLYGKLLEKVAGQEMMVGTYVGFSIVAGMAIFWLTAPIKNPSMIFAIGGQGLRYTLTLQDYFGGILNNFLAFDIVIGKFTMNVPTGLLLFFGLFCVLLYLFFRSRTGLAMLAVGSNPQYAASSGVNIRRMRYTGVIMSTVLGAIGILVYAQSYGFLQLYNAPLYMAFPAIAAILIGGATLRKATISQVIIGSVLFFTLLTTALPVVQTVLDGSEVGGGISEIARMIIQNGTILYALTRVGRR